MHDASHGAGTMPFTGSHAAFSGPPHRSPDWLLSTGSTRPSAREIRVNPPPHSPRFWPSQTAPGVARAVPIPKRGSSFCLSLTEWICPLSASSRRRLVTIVTRPSSGAQSSAAKRSPSVGAVPRATQLPCTRS
ncbi:hypothetical protein E5A74_05615 [Sphingomonas naasensis]|uniref:Uncharacterized protein n=1 Tax=Sphingomonas naasensis TaxID=1344951 RepID=A0A4S1WLZ6_9SPHN|nr:hypothetical protein E5A74_05615 [Sphingomonas naasensis]